MRRDTDRIKRKLKESIEVDLLSTPVDVVVMGPNLGDGTAAAKLRRDIIAAAGEYGATIQPEHGGLIHAARQRFQGGHHLTALEIQLVEISDLVVLIPASAGSLCELGLFGTYEWSSQKMLVLASDEFPRSGTYVADGPLTAAKHYRAEIHYVDYCDFSQAWRYVEQRLQRIRVERTMVRITKGR